jgi:hypothetical protein
MTSAPDFDIALSFAGEDRAYVDAVAHALRDKGVKVFYDLFEEVNLWGKDLYVHLSEVYQRRARFTVMFISAAYARKLWTNHERRAAQARAFHEAQEYILPARFDDTEIPGVLPTIGYISLDGRSPEQLASLVTQKLVSVGGSIPTELIRRDFSSTLTYSTANPTRCIIIVEDDLGAPIAGCALTAQADNGTAIEGVTDASGHCELVVNTQRIYRLLVAHPNYPAAVVEHVEPAEGIKILLHRSQNVGSTVIHGSGQIPGLQGRLNPILDTSNRLYLYADNIAIDGGKLQPVPFSINVPIELEDANGTIIFVTIKQIAGRISLLQYTRRV